MNSITEPINTGDYEYIVLENGTVEITGYTGSARELVIPAKLDGHVVSSLGAEAFGGCDSLTRITIPGSVVCIGKNPFTGCLILTDVLVAADHPTLETIDGVLFEKRTRTLLCCPCAFPQKHYTIPQGTKAIGDYAFDNCEALISVTIPDSVTSIGDSAFFGCEALTSVAIPDSVVSIGTPVFSFCSSLTSITIPCSVASFGFTPASRCYALTSILVAADHPTLETIDGVLFEKRTRTLLCCPCAFPQKHYTIPQGTKAIGNYAFEDCDALISVTIPDSVTSIGEYAFDGCESLTSVAIPDSVVSIGNHAFYHCLALTSVNIPDGVTIIGDHTFGSCASLPSITIPDSVTSIGDYAFHSCNVLTSITIPDSVTSIGDEAFDCCISLTSITIPDSVTHIGADAFRDCSALTAITVGRDSFAAQYCKDNGLPYTFAEDVQP